MRWFIQQILDGMTDNLRLVAFIVIGVFLSAYGFWNITPAVLLMDEWMAVVRALSLRQEPFIQSVRKGGNLHLYLLFLTFSISYSVMVLTGTTTEVSIDPASFMDPGNQFLTFALAGRMFSISLTVASIVLTYLLVSRIYGRERGTYAAGALSVSAGFLVTGHLATEDILLVATSLCVFVSLAYFVTTGSKQYLYLGAVMGGLSVSAKAIGGLLILPFLLTLYLYPLNHETKIEKVWDVLVFGIIGTVMYAVTTPTLVVHPVVWWESIARYLFGFGSSSTPSVSATEPIHVLLAAIQHVGLPLFFASILGIGIATIGLRRGSEHPFSAVLLVYFVPYVVLVSLLGGGIYWRLTAVIPILAVFSGQIFTYSRRNYGRIGAVVVIGILVFSLVYSGAVVSTTFGPDPRSKATEWTMSNLDADTEVDVIGHRLHTPRIPEGTNFTRYRSLTPERMERIKSAKPEYIVTTSSNYRKYYNNPDFYRNQSKTFQRLLSGATEYEIVKRFGPSAKLSKRSRVDQFQADPFAPYDRNMYSLNPTIVILKRR